METMPVSILSYLSQKVTELPPLDVPGTVPSEEATLVTATGLYVQDVPHTSTLRSLSW